jgi:hypothetical protein
MLRHPRHGDTRGAEQARGPRVARAPADAGPRSQPERQRLTMSYVHGESAAFEDRMRQRVA